MAFDIKTWVDRVSEYPNRRRLTKEDSSQEVVSVERYEGNITEPGDKFNADTMNDLEDRIDSAISGIESSAIKTITRSGKTFTAIRLDNTTFTFTQQDTTYSNATTSAAGLMSAADKTKLDGIAANANKYTLPTASSTTLGGIKVGSNLSISDGVLSATKYTLPTASSSVLGGIKVGSNLSISNGVLSANAYSLPTASASTLGGIKVGSGLSISSGVLSSPQVKISLGAQSITVAANGGYVTITDGKPSGTILACIPCGIAHSDLGVSGPQSSTLANMKAGKFHVYNTSNVSVTGTMHVLWVYY